ncbi:hypothetical protein MRB53_002381 [Persea americana]|uniref:Uncharacterized protein n=1 Tax=Persea americana TaxID=3435 RepID=A0ACC2MUP5_PERAE|nr:hypothetical protein MRB53_002381 [Persea americana]
MASAIDGSSSGGGSMRKGRAREGFLEAGGDKKDKLPFFIYGIDQEDKAACNVIDAEIGREIRPNFLLVGISPSLLEEKERFDPESLPDLIVPFAGEEGCYERVIETFFASVFG